MVEDGVWNNGRHMPNRLGRVGGRIPRTLNGCWRYQDRHIREVFHSGRIHSSQVVAARVTRRHFISETNMSPSTFKSSSSSVNRGSSHHFQLHPLCVNTSKQPELLLSVTLLTTQLVLSLSSLDSRRNATCVQATEVVSQRAR